MNKIHTEHRAVCAGEVRRVSAESQEDAAAEEATLGDAAIKDAAAADTPVAEADVPEGEGGKLQDEAALEAVPGIVVRTRVLSGSAAGSRWTARAMLPGLDDGQGRLAGLEGDAGAAADDGEDADEAEFRIEAVRPETVAPGLRVTLLYPGSRKRRTILISGHEHAPDDDIIHTGRPLAQALIGATVEATMEFDQDGRTIRVMVEGIEPELRAAE